MRIGILCLALLGAGCGDDGRGSAGRGGAGGGPPDAAPVDASAPQGPCNAVTAELPEAGFAHVAVGTPLTYSSNPPASGDHFPAWARWGAHDTVIERGFWLHNLEHGGVVLLHRCEGACPEVSGALAEVAMARPQDPLCPSPLRSRLLVTPDPLLDVPVAAAAWRRIYRADCVDRPSLEAFIDASYGKGREAICADGQVP